MVICGSSAGRRTGISRVGLRRERVADGGGRCGPNKAERLVGQPEKDLPALSTERFLLGPVARSSRQHSLALEAYGAGPGRRYCSSLQ